MIGTPGSMGPPPIQPINGGGGQSGGQSTMPAFNFYFNPTGGVGNSGGFQGGGPGWMPPPPIQGIGTGFPPTGNPMQRPPGWTPQGPMPPVRVPPPGGVTQGGRPGAAPGGPAIPPITQPPAPPPQIPGWAGYLQWLNFMGGRLPPPPIQGI